MKTLLRAAGVCVLTTGLALPLATLASAAGSGVEVLAAGLATPLQVEVGPNGTIYVTEADAGQVTQIDKKGRRSVFAAGLGTFAPGLGVQGGKVFVSTSDETPAEGEEHGGQVAAALKTISQGGKVTKTVDLFAYELGANPDGQTQYDEDGHQVDALSNPYDVLGLPGRTLIADAGGNVINSVSASGVVTTLTKLPVSYEGDCATATNNTKDGHGCDPVPTGLVLGPDGDLYVSGLGSFVEGHVWRISLSTGAILDHWGGLPPLTGIAAGPDGSLYVSSLFVDTVFRLAPGSRAVNGAVELPTPTGLAFSAGSLLVTSGFTGQLFRVPAAAFG